MITNLIICIFLQKVQTLAVDICKDYATLEAAVTQVKLAEGSHWKQL